MRVCGLLFCVLLVCDIVFIATIMYYPVDKIQQTAGDNNSATTKPVRDGEYWDCNDTYIFKPKSLSCEWNCDSWMTTAKCRVQLLFELCIGITEPKNLIVTVSSFETLHLYPLWPFHHIKLCLRVKCGHILPNIKQKH